MPATKLAVDCRLLATRKVCAETRGNAAGEKSSQGVGLVTRCEYNVQ